MFRKSEGVVSRAVDGEAVVVRLADRRVFVLNAAATLVWDALGEGLDGEKLSQKTAAFLEDLCSKGLAVRDGSRGGASLPALTGHPEIKAEEELNAVAAVCNSSYNLEPACRTTPATCTTLFE